jgi:hypothetical protein
MTDDITSIILYIYWIPLIMGLIVILTCSLCFLSLDSYLLHIGMVIENMFHWKNKKKHIIDIVNVNPHTRYLKYIFRMTDARYLLKISLIASNNGHSIIKWSSSSTLPSVRFWHWWLRNMNPLHIVTHLRVSFIKLQSLGVIWRKSKKICV